MLKKARDIFFVEEAKAAKSDVAVLIIMGIALIYAGYALYQMGGF